ncbi:uncharacterized protein PSFLO_00438 [Pseudozyma flocculosa]|uniref:Uncharacterized protein n=1 Tax=Pseudozyma flocculosa TaxID=84751 RepID=A0A5C3EU14_9BASI|nr:uncharacterized protein PSFLO_00438 [Pseudozyma flocculosa]
MSLAVSTCTSPRASSPVQGQRLSCIPAARARVLSMSWLRRFFLCLSAAATARIHTTAAAQALRIDGAPKPAPTEVPKPNGHHLNPSTPDQHHLKLRLSSVDIKWPIYVSSPWAARSTWLGQVGGATATRGIPCCLTSPTEWGPIVHKAEDRYRSTSLRNGSDGPCGNLATKNSPGHEHGSPPSTRSRQVIRWEVSMESHRAPSSVPDPAQRGGGLSCHAVSSPWRIAIFDLLSLFRLEAAIWSGPDASIGGSGTPMSRRTYSGPLVGARERSLEGAPAYLRFERGKVAAPKAGVSSRSGTASALLIDGSERKGSLRYSSTGGRRADQSSTPSRQVRDQQSLLRLRSQPAAQPSDAVTWLRRIQRCQCQSGYPKIFATRDEMRGGIRQEEMRAEGNEQSGGERPHPHSRTRLSLHMSWKPRQAKPRSGAKKTNTSHDPTTTSISSSSSIGQLDFLATRR